MSKNDEAEEREAVRKLVDMLQSWEKIANGGGKEPDFSETEIEALKRVAAREIGWMALKGLGGELRKIAGIVGGLVLAWVAFKGWLQEWLIALWTNKP